MHRCFRVLVSGFMRFLPILRHPAVNGGGHSKCAFATSFAGNRRPPLTTSFGISASGTSRGSRLRTSPTSSQMRHFPNNHSPSNEHSKFRPSHTSRALEGGNMDYQIQGLSIHAEHRGSAERRSYSSTTGVGSREPGVGSCRSGRAVHDSGL